MAKRYKNIRYSIGLAIAFLMSGVGAFSENINNENDLNIETSNKKLRGIEEKSIFTRNEIDNSVDT